MTDEIPTFGGSEETLQEREKRWEKEKRGLIADLQKERAERQALEERTSLIESSLSEPDPAAVNVQERINRFTQDPDSYIDERVEERISERLEPIQKILTNQQVKDKLDDSFEWISDQENISKREAKKKYDEELARIVQSHGFGGLDPYEGTIAAYKILKQESKEKEEREADRDRNINGQSTEPVRSTPRSNGRFITTEEIKNMSLEEYTKRKDEIMTAQKNGWIKQT